MEKKARGKSGESAGIIRLSRMIGEGKRRKRTRDGSVAGDGVGGMKHQPPAVPVVPASTAVPGIEDEDEDENHLPTSYPVAFDKVWRQGV